MMLPPPTSERYVPYVNDRYGFAVDRPAFLVPQRPPDNDDGREFRKGRIVMRAYAGWNVDGATPASTLKSHAKGVRPTLAVARRDWYALSYAKGGTIFYEKAFVSRTKATTVEFEYPVSERARMGPVVARVARSLRP